MHGAKTSLNKNEKRPSVNAFILFRFFAALSVFLAILVVSPSRNIFTSSARSAQDIVDLALVLAVDCSYSVDSVEYRLQMEGLARAFRTSKVIDAIKNGPSGRIAVSVVQW